MKWLAEKKKKLCSSNFMPVTSLQQETNPPPVHVAIILDGNRRWAQRRGLPNTIGHKRGAEAVRRAVEGAFEFGISYLTLYGFSSENWKRPALEVDDLMELLRHYLRSEIAELHSRGVRIKVIGERDGLPNDIIDLISDAEKRTENNSALCLNVALNYGGRREIILAARRLLSEALEAGLDPTAIDENMFADHLATVGIPDPDLVIRTGGEKRLSNFLLWQSAYAELVFIDTLWPDFTKRDLEDAINEFCQRERRYGASSGRS